MNKLGYSRCASCLGSGKVSVGYILRNCEGCGGTGYIKGEVAVQDVVNTVQEQTNTEGQAVTPVMPITGDKKAKAKRKTTQAIDLQPRFSGRSNNTKPKVVDPLPEV